jgi:hypothetical protein
MAVVQRALTELRHRTLRHSMVFYRAAEGIRTLDPELGELARGS